MLSQKATSTLFKVGVKIRLNLSYLYISASLNYIKASVKKFLELWRRESGVEPDHQVELTPGVTSDLTDLRSLLNFRDSFIFTPVYQPDCSSDLQRLVGFLCTALAGAGGEMYFIL